MLRNKDGTRLTVDDVMLLVGVAAIVTGVGMLWGPGGALIVGGLMMMALGAAGIKERQG
jgi:hypothetical protein